MTTTTSMFIPTRSKAPDNKPSTPAQHKFYRDLCEQKKRTPREDLDQLNFNAMSDLIEEIKAYYPPSEAQLKYINECIADLKSVGINIEVDFSLLTGGRNGTASPTLEKLFALREEHCPKKDQPPTENQLKFACSMYLCPAVAFEDYGVSRWVYLEDGFKRRPTDEEFIAILKETFTRSTISEFLNKFRSEFNDWKQTRIRPGQLNYIKALLEQNGSQIDELTLYQFSQDEAGAYIEQLLNENKRELPSSIIEVTHDLPITITTIKQAEDVEEENLKGIIYSLIAETGCEPVDDIEEMLGNSEMIIDYFVYLIEENHLTPERLQLLMEDSSTLATIFQTLIN